MEKFKDLTNKNISNIKVYKNKPVSENYWMKLTAHKCTLQLNIWRYDDLETYELCEHEVIRR